MESAPQQLMYFTSLPQLLVVLLLVVVLFGKGKVSDLMGDVAKGIKSFKKGLAEDEDQPAAAPQPPAKPIDHDPLRTETKTPAGTETKV